MRSPSYPLAAHLLAAGLLLLATSCGRDGLIRSNVDGPCTRDADCLDDLACFGGFCTAEGGNNANDDPNNSPDCAGAGCDEDPDPDCDPGARRCQDHAVFVCGGEGTWELERYCSDRESCIEDRCVNVVDVTPDLVVTDAKLLDTAVLLGEQFVVEVVVQNEGSGYAAPSRCVAFTEVQGEAVELASAPLEGLDPGNGVDLVIPASTRRLAPGHFSIGVRCDPDNLIVEEREDNNVTFADPPLELVGDAALPDLVTLSVEPENTLVAPGGQARFLFFIANMGTAPMSDVHCVFSLLPGDVLLGEWWGPGLLPNEEGTGEAAFTVPRNTAPGLHPVTLYCEALPGEANLSNNTATTQLQIEGPSDRRPDLYFTAFEPVMGNLRAGDTATLSGELCSEGGSASAPTAIDFTLDLTGLHLGRLNVPALRDECWTFQFESTPLTCPRGSGHYFISALLDPDNRVAERDEGNNTATAAGSLNINCDLVCIGDRYDAPDTPDRPVVQPEELGLILCSGDIDLFTLPATPALPLEIALTLHDPAQDLHAELMLQREDGTTSLFSADSVGGRLTLAFDAVEPDALYLLAISAFNSDTLTYDLRWSQAEIDPPEVCEDANEPNNTFSQAALLDEASGTAQHLCPVGDVDLFRLPLMAGDSADLHVVAAADAPPGDLSVTVYGPTQSFITFRFARDVTIPIVAAESGDHYVRVVTSANSDAYTYTIFTQR